MGQVVRQQEAKMGMTFGSAIEHLKVGQRVARYGWNGKSMWLVLILPGDGGEDAIVVKDVDAQAYFSANNEPAMLKLDPVLAMRTAKGTLQLGWLASQADILADDWEVLSNV
jgi:hypothetical protein